MAAVEDKLGPMWDQLVLQVHSDNAHAAARFREKYGFVSAKVKLGSLLNP